jgi:hypothetical protein
MRMLSTQLKITCTTLLCALLLAACSGGGGAGTSASNGAAVTGSTPANSTPTSSNLGTTSTGLPSVPTAGYPWKVWTPDPVAVPPSTTGKTYYVDTATGSDTNDGLGSAKALKTITKSTRLVAAGDTVLIRKGLYREGIVLISTASGTADKPITFGSYGDGEVIVDGSTPVGPWTKVGASSSTVWQAVKTFEPIGVVVNDVPLKQVTQGQGGSTAPRVDLAGVTNGSGKWHNGATQITADMGALNPNTADIVVPNNVGDQNHVYFYDKTHLRFVGLTVRGSGSNGIWGYGGNITIDHCNIKFNGKSAVSFQPLNTPGMNENNAVLYTRAYHNVLLNWPRGNNFFAEAGGGWAGGIAWSGNYGAVARGNISHMNGGEGIISYGAGTKTGSTLFEQNVSFDNWSVNMYFDNQPNNVARNNILYNHPVDFNPSTSNFLYIDPAGREPYGNLGKFSVGFSISDEYNSGNAPNYASIAGSKVYNNIIAGHRIAILDYAEGTPTQGNHGIIDTLIANNTIILPAVQIPNVLMYGIFLRDNTTISGTNRNRNSFIQNNILYGFTADAPLIWAQNQKALDGITLSNNLYYNASSTTPLRLGFDAGLQNLSFNDWRTQTGKDVDSKNVNPQLANVAGFQTRDVLSYDYKNADLSATSPARSAGVAQTLFGFDFAGAVRSVWNMGAF